MITFSLFVISGVAIASITLAKRFEEQRRKSPMTLILNAISKGDERFRDYHHKALHTYSIGKDKVIIIVTKQLPMRAKSLANKTLSYTQDKLKTHVNNMRDAKLLKKSDGISEFFKSISEIEKGGGEINESLESDALETKEGTYIVTFVPEAQKTETAPEVAEAPKKRAPRKKKIKVVEID